MTTGTIKKLDKRSMAYKRMSEWLEIRGKLEAVQAKEAELKKEVLTILSTCPDDSAVVDGHLLEKRWNNSTSVPYKDLYTEALTQLPSSARTLLLEKQESITKKSSYEKIYVKVMEEDI